MAEKMAHSSDQTPTPQQSNPPVATAGTSANIITAATKWIRKTTKNLASLKSQSKQFIAPNGTQINMDTLSSSIAVFTTKSESGLSTFNQDLGTNHTTQSVVKIETTQV